MHTRLDANVMEAALARIERSNRRSLRPRTESGRWTPVHTLRVAADAFTHDSVRRAGARALRLVQSYAPDSVVLALALRLPGFEAMPTDPGRVDALLARLEQGDPQVPPGARLAHEVYRRLLRQLQVAPVQDLRIDFHDAFGRRSDEEEDAAAGAAASEAALGLREGTLCPQIGIRTAPLSGARAARALRTIDLFVSTMCDRAGGAVPPRFLVSVPEITHEDQVTALVQIVSALETRLQSKRGSIGLELGFADASVVFDESGSCRLAPIVAASSGRCAVVRLEAGPVARSLGARDPAAAIAVRDLARIALASAGVAIAFGSSPDLPRSGGDRGPEAAQRYTVVHAAWRTHADAVLRALRDGSTWGWDTDAGQIPARLAAIGTYYRQNLGQIRHSLEEWSRNGLDGAEDGQRLFDEIRIGIRCGAITAEDLAGTGFEPEDFAPAPGDPSDRP
ncbi:MAG: hypothetical protein ABMB14_20585 [Myxococcota bacterium]